MQNYTWLVFLRICFPSLASEEVGHHDNDSDRKDINIHYNVVACIDRKAME